MNVHIIIGKNFGDEGKGLATDYFSAGAQRRGVPCLVVRHNGGAQAGHTVDLPDWRFVFHQLSSGSFRGADTYWAETFLPDLYKLREEQSDFRAAGGAEPRIFASPRCRCTLIDDVLVNMALETSRGESRHGSCGMGINEAVERSAIPEFSLTLGDILGMDCSALAARMAEIRREYLPKRLEALGLATEDMGEFGELLRNPHVIANAAEEMCRAVETVAPVREDAVLRGYGTLVFEGAQGLLLDAQYLRYAPHLTSSRTGLTNPAAFCKQYLPGAAVEAVYVSRTYVTRHGAGPLPGEGQLNPEEYGIGDKTNLPNPWQGGLRFAPHPDPEQFFQPMEEDIRKAALPLQVSLMLTHCNETGGCLLFSGKKQPTDLFLRQYAGEGRIGGGYLSASPYSADIRKME